VHLVVVIKGMFDNMRVNGREHFTLQNTFLP